LIEQCTNNHGRIERHTWTEFSNAVNGLKLKNCKAPGLNGVPPDPEAFKAIDGECRMPPNIFDFLMQYQYFDGERD
jgi:hypothetical protein